MKPWCVTGGSKILLYNDMVNKIGFRGREMSELGKKRLPDGVLEKVAERFKLLSEPMRLRLIQAMTDGEKSVSELVEETGGLQANVSKHLGILLESGVIGRRKQGLRAYYRITDETVFELCDLVCGSIQDRLLGELERFSLSSTSARDRLD
jgi:DNA-binding transcriptional ArsR family regulator